jgi:hypothetical protein
MSVVDISDQIKRYDYASNLSRALTINIQEWFAGHPYRAEAIIDDDRRGWNLTAIKPSELPPLDMWALQLGDIAHNYRSFLNGIVAALTISPDANTPAQPSIVQFPISSTRKDWKKSKLRINHLPMKYQERIQNIQPFHRIDSGEGVTTDLLFILNKLNNQDKHTLQVIPAMQLSAIIHEFQIEFETEEDAAKSTQPQLKAIGQPNITTGGVILKLATQGRISKVKGNVIIEGGLQIKVSGTFYNVIEILKGFTHYTADVVNYILHD